MSEGEHTPMISNLSFNLVSNARQPFFAASSGVGPVPIGQKMVRS